MRKISAWCWMFFLSVPAVLAQRVNIPQPVAQQFSRQFGQTQNVQWIALNNNNYKADFNENGVVKTVVFARSGQWLSIENPVTANELPASVTRTLASEYAGYVINEANRVETFGRGIGFRMKIRTKNGSFELEVGNNGRIYRRTPVGRQDSCDHPRNKRGCHHNKSRRDCDDDDDDDD